MNLDRKLMAYAAGAAAAAGLAGAGRAEADVVATNGPFEFGIDGVIDINFDQDPGTPRDFGFAHERAKDAEMMALPQTDRVILKEDDNGAAGEAYVALNGQPAALTPGTEIGPNSFFDNAFFNNGGNRLIDEDVNDDGVADETPTGNFTADNVVGNTQYLGVRFLVNDEGLARYGWIGVDFTNAADKTGRVTGYAYQTDPNVGIRAGATSEPWRVADANNDGSVNVADLGILATNFNQSFNGRESGDFNGDGQINVTDLGLLATHFGQPASGVNGVSFEQALANYPDLAAAVPEPASGLALLALGATGLLRRRTA